MKELKFVNKIILYVYSLFYDFWNLKPSKLDLDRKNIKNKEKKMYIAYGEYASKNNIWINHIMKKEHTFIVVDLIWARQMSYKYKIKNYKQGLFRSYFRVLSTKKGFYFNFNNLKDFNNLNIMLTHTFLSGFKYIWLGLRFWIFPLLVLFSIVYATLVLRAVPFNKVMFGWISILMFSYWLISGFVFFF